MAIEIIPSIKGCLDAVEAGISPFDENNLSFGLQAFVDAPESLTDNERKGCRAEIFGLRFITANTEQRPPWNLYFVPMASGVRNDGTEVYQPDALDMDSEIIQYWQDRPYPCRAARRGLGMCGEYRPTVSGDPAIH